jgi:DNA-directed RNA polymerase beta subunit
MLGSTSCHLYGYTIDELRRVGEDSNDPFGYFIIRGGERLIINQENLCFSQPLTKMDDKSGMIDTRVTTPGLSGSSVVSVAMGKNWPVVRVTIMPPGLKNTVVKKYSMFSVFDALLQLGDPATFAYDPFVFPEVTGLTSTQIIKRRDAIVERAIDMIERFILPEHRDKIASFMTASRAKYDTIDWPLREILTKRTQGVQLSSAAEAATLTAVRRAAALKISTGTGPGNSVDDATVAAAASAAASAAAEFESASTKDVFSKIVLIDLFKDLFSNTESSDYEGKLLLLSRVVSQQMLVVAGVRPVDDRDGWENKRVKLPADSFSQTFNSVFKLTVENGRLLRTGSSLMKQFLTLFSSAALPGRENIIHMVKRDTPVALISQIGRVNVSANAQSKQFNLRLLQPSQVGYCCVAETPCSDRCGLTKNLACSAWISLRRDSDKFIETIAKPIVAAYGRKDYHPKTSPHPVFVDNTLIGWGDGPMLSEAIRAVAKSNMEFFDTCVTFNEIDRMVDIFTTGTRPTRPLFTVDQATGVLTIDKLPPSAYEWPIEKLIEAGAIEYINSAEQQYIRVAERPSDVKGIIAERRNPENTPPTGGYLRLYSEISALALLGPAAALMPVPNTCQGPRVTYQSGMIAQALGAYNDSYYDRMDTMFKRIEGTRPMFETAVAGPIGLNRAPTGRMLVVAFIALANNGEDGIIFKREALERLQMTKYSTRKVIARGIVPGWRNPSKPTPDGVDLAAAVSSAASSGKIVEIFARPPAAREEAAGTQEYARYHAIQPNGLPRIGAIISKGDCIVGRVRTFVDVSGKETITNASDMAGVGDEGIVDRVEVIEGREGETYARVKIRQTRPLIAGDKVASRYSQKGTISTKRSNISATDPGRMSDKEAALSRLKATATGGEKALREAIVAESARGATAEETESEIVGVRFAKDLPRVASGPNKGLVADVYVNSHSIPSRMTMGFLAETLASKAAAYTGERIDGTAFTDFLGDQLERARSALAENGLDPDGFEKMEHPDGTPYHANARIFMGPCYYQFLRHTVSDKFQYRSKGNIRPDTRQPVHGRSKEGGLRQGEMERSAMCSWGATELLRERMMLASDVYPFEICTTCGNQALTNHRLGSKECPICPMGKENIGIVTTPFIHILISRMVASLGIQAKLVQLKKTERSDDY